MTERKFQPGFRLSLLDVVILLAGGAAAAAAASADVWLGAAIAFVVLHFFFFCNVLRMSRPLELTWAAAFVALAAAAPFGLLSWPAVFALSAVVTVIVAIVQVGKPSYHGIGWQRLNPRLPTWWQSTAGGARR